jgi:hypothetical protein
LSAGISRRRDGQERPSCQGRRDNCYGLQQNLLIAKDTMRSLLFVIKSRLAMMGDRAATEGSKTADCAPLIDLRARQLISIIRPCPGFQSDYNPAYHTFSVSSAHARNAGFT